LYKIGVSDYKTGKFTTYALSDIITANNAQFIGNYKIVAFYSGFTASTAIALPHYQVHTNLEDVVNIKTTALKFSYPLMSSYYSAGRDIIVAENTTIIENSGYVENNEIYTYVQDGNIIVKKNATLIISRNTVLSIRQSAHKKYFVSIEDQGKLIIDSGSSIVSNEPLNLYLFGNAILQTSNGSSLRLNIISSDNAKINLANTAIDGSVYAKCAEARFENVIANSSYLIFNLTALTLTNSQLVTNKLEIAASAFEITDCSFNQPLKLKHSGYLTNVTAPEITTEEIIYKCWWLNADVKNGHELPIDNAEIRIYSYNNLTEVFYTSARTDQYGIARFKLLGSITTPGGEEFVGNYKAVAYYVKNQKSYKSNEARFAMTDNKKIALRFAEILVPPYEITVTLEFPAHAEPDSTITISGEVLYNKGPDRAANANITIEIVETGFVINTTTDSGGRYTCSITVPRIPGSYTVKVYAREPAFNMSAEISKPLVSQLRKVEYNLLPIIGCIILAAICLVGIRFLVYNKQRAAAATEAEASATERRITRSTILRWLIENNMRSGRVK
jgi:hypothetical protein